MNIETIVKKNSNLEKPNEIFNKYIQSGKHFTVKLIGDSILQGVNGTGFQQDGEKIVGNYRRNPNGYCWGNLFKNLLEEKYNCSVTNNGCRGTWTGWCIENWDALIDERDDIIICCYGTNDRGFTPEQSVLLSNYKKIIDKANENGSDIIFVSGIPAGAGNELNKFSSYPQLYYHMEDVDRLLAEATNSNYISLFNEVNNWLTYTDKELTDYLDRPQLHPNDELYTKMFIWICKSLGIATK